MLYWQGCQISSHRIEKQIKYEQNFIIRNIISSTILITAEVIEKHSPTLNRDTEYTKTMAISRLPGYMTIQMVRWVLWYINHLQQTLCFIWRFHFKQKEAVNAKVLKDIKFPVMLDMFDMCSKELQDKLKPTRTDFKAYEDWLVDQVCISV